MQRNIGPSLCEQLRIGKVVSIDDQSVHYPSGQLGLMVMQPRNKLVHFIGHSSTAAADKDLARAVQGFGNRAEKAGGIRFFLAS